MNDDLTYTYVNGRIHDASGKPISPKELLAKRRLEEDA